MSSTKTTLEYRPMTGQFIVSSHLRGHDQPVTRMVPEFDLRRIGDQDVDHYIEEAKMFPHRAIPVASHQLRRAA